MGLYLICLIIMISAWDMFYGWDFNTDKCDSVEPTNLIPLKECNVLLNDKHFLHVSCDFYCFINTSTKLGPEINAISMSVGFTSKDPVLSVNEPICLWTTNFTIEKFPKLNFPLHGTLFILIREMQRDLAEIVEQKIVALYEDVRRIMAVAFAESLCNVSSSHFQVSAIDDKRNTSCKLRIYGIKAMLLTDHWIYKLILELKIWKAIDKIKEVYLLDKIISPFFLIRFKGTLFQIKIAFDLISNHKLLQLHFLGSNFGTIVDFDFREFTYLEVLNLTGGVIHTIEAHAFESLKNLSVLDLSYNQLQTIPAALSTSSLPKLISLNMEGNTPKSKSFIVSSDVDTTSNLSVLRLSKTPIHELKINAFSSFTKLKKLYLDQCDIANLSRNSFSNLTYLSTLDLAKNNMHSFPEDIFRPLLSLKYLNLSHNQFVDINLEHFFNLSKITSLNLEDNEIVELPSNFPRSLEELNLRANHIRQWRNPVNFSHIHHLDLSLNYISVLTKEMQVSLEGIDRVNLSMNPFDCDPCPLYILHTWLQKQNAESPNLHFCSHPSSLLGKVALDLPTNQQDCLLTTVNVSLVVSLVLLFAIAALTSVAYYRRRDIVYYSFRFRSFIQQQHYRRNNTYLAIKD